MSGNSNSNSNNGSRIRTWLMWAAVVALTVVPLVWVGQGPVDDTGAAGELFEGADSRAQQAITRIAPDYQPWFHPVLEPSSNEIASLLFALQAALGAGVIGYWLGVSKARASAVATSAHGPALPDSAAPSLHGAPGTPGTPGVPAAPGTPPGSAPLAAPAPGSASH